MSQKTIDIDPEQPIEQSLKQLQLEPSSLIVLLGAFDPSLNNQVRSICSRAIAPAALKSRALILDDGKTSGCAAAIGQAALDQDEPLQLLAVIPNGRAAD